MNIYMYMNTLVRQQDIYCVCYTQSGYFTQSGSKIDPAWSMGTLLITGM